MDQSIQHFSHQHPLKLVNFQPETTNAFICAGCKLEASGWFYFCSTCNYCLHKTCSYMPQNKEHRVDSKHTLVLLSSPAYAAGSFKCDACGKLGTGFCYHCKDCQLDIHTLCIYKPSSVDVNSHHHTLELCFKPPYSRNKFQCNICKKSGSNHWLYRCGACKYDVHMNCAMSNQLQPGSEIQLTPIQHSTDSTMSTLPLCHNAIVSADPQPVTEIRQTHQGKVTDVGNRYAQAVTSIQQTQQRPKLLKSRSFPARYPEYTTDRPSSVASMETIADGSSNWNQAYRVYDHSASMKTIAVVPQYVQAPNTTKPVNNIMGHVVQELVGGFIQQAGGAIFDSLASGDLPFDLNIDDL